MRNLHPNDLTSVNGGASMGELQADLSLAAGGLGLAAAVTRFVPGAQVLSIGLTVLSIGVGGLASAASMYKSSGFVPYSTK